MSSACCREAGPGCRVRPAARGWVRLAEYLALYRSFRPRRFAEVVGQEHVTRTLRNAVAAGRVAHAYLFSGPRGTGKTSVARILARAVNCQAPDQGEPCNQCLPCLEVLSGQSLDVIEVDAASHRGIDEVRTLRDQARYAPARCTRKVYIVDEVHMLTADAFNALLKTLEEPPATVVFVLATTDAHRVPPTVASRCQRFEFHRLSEEEIAGQIQRVLAAIGAEAEEEAVFHLARAADGALRDALTLLDQALAGAAVPGRLGLSDVTGLLGSVPEEELATVLRHVLSGDVGGVMDSIQDLYRKGREARQVILGLLRLARSCLVARVNPGRSGAASEVAQRLATESLGVPWDRLVALFDGLARLEQDLRRGGPSLLVLEVGLVHLALAGVTPFPPVAAPHSLSTAGAAPPRAGGEAPRAGREEPPARPRARSGPGVLGVPEVPTAAAAGHGAAGSKGEGPAAVRPDPGSLWRRMMERVRRERPLLHGVLISARPVALRGEELVVTFRPDCTFHRDRVAEPRNKAYLEKLLSLLAGRSIRLRCHVGEAEAGGLAVLRPPGEAAGGDQVEEAETGIPPSGERDSREGRKGSGEDAAAAALEVLGGQLVDLEVDGLFAADGGAQAGLPYGGEAS